MTSIKPPSTGPHTLPDVGETHKSEGTPGSSFQQVLDQAAAAQTGPTGQAVQTGQAGQISQISQAPQVSGTSPSGDIIAALANDVEAGRVSLDQAVDRLLQQTLSKVDRHLNSEQVGELSGLLRDALLTDPTLRALRGERS